jgi:hypothetical protein
MLSAWIRERATRECRDIANDGDLQAGKIRFVTADGERIQHPLGGMGMTAIAGVEDRDVRLDMAGHEVRRAALRVTHHEHVALHRLDVAQSVEQAFALGRGRGGDVEVQHIGRQSLGRQFEGGASSGAGLEEQVDHGLAVQGRQLFDSSFGHAAQRFGGVEDLRQMAAGQPFHGQEMQQPALAVQLEVGGAHGTV